MTNLIITITVILTKESERTKTHIYIMDDDGNAFSPAWHTINLKTSFNINKHLTFNAGVENITNYCYRPYSSWIFAPGVNGIFTVRAGL